MFDLDWQPHPPPDFLSVHPWRRGREFATPRGHCMLHGYTLQSGPGCCSSNGFHKPQPQRISSAGKHTQKKRLFHLELEKEDILRTSAGKNGIITTSAGKKEDNTTSAGKKRILQVQLKKNPG